MLSNRRLTEQVFTAGLSYCRLCDMALADTARIASCSMARQPAVRSTIKVVALADVSGCSLDMLSHRKCPICSRLTDKERSRRIAQDRPTLVAVVR